MERCRLERSERLTILFKLAVSLVAMLFSAQLLSLYWNTLMKITEWSAINLGLIDAFIIIWGIYGVYVLVRIVDMMCFHQIVFLPEDNKDDDQYAV
jgi:hypothetical protein